MGTAGAEAPPPYFLLLLRFGVLYTRRLGAVVETAFDGAPWAKGAGHAAGCLPNETWRLRPPCPGLISPPTALAAAGRGCDTPLNLARCSEVWGIQKSNGSNARGMASVTCVPGDVPQLDVALGASVGVAFHLGLELTRIGDLNKVSLFPSHLEGVSQRTSRDWQAARRHGGSRLLPCVCFSFLA